MPIESIEREIQVGYLQLSAAARRTMRYGATSITWTDPAARRPGPARTRSAS